MKLVYVHEEFQEKHESEFNELSETHYITGHYEDNVALWEEVGQYIENRYELEKVSLIYLLCDGAP